MNNKPLVSVICLCYNHAKYVGEALHSVASQTYENIEIIVVDDFSTDHSADAIGNWIKENPEAVLIRNKSNTGNTKAFNKAIKIAKGEYIIDLAADDVLLPDCVEALIDRFMEHRFANIGAVYGNAELITETGDKAGYFFPVGKDQKVLKPIPTGQIYNAVIDSESIICPVAMMVKRSVYKALGGGYDENLAYEDLDFWIRSSRVFDYDFVDRILSKKRILKNSLGSQYKKVFSRKANRINNSTYQVLKSAFENTNQSGADDKALLKRVHFLIIATLKTLNFGFVLKYLILKLRIHSKKRAAGS